MSKTALLGATIVLPDRLLADHALLIEAGLITAWVPEHLVPADAERIELEGGWLLPGFIDTQVNGGGDLLLNDSPTREGLATIAAAHRRYGTTGLMPTLISDEPAIVDRAISAVEAAMAEHMPGILGLHIEGPHLNPGKRGIHDAAKIAPLDPARIDKLAAPSGGARLITLAPEAVPPGAIAELSARGVIVAAGHSLADYAQTKSALVEGLSGFTHLFNAMTQLGSREPGMVGAALEAVQSFFGLIVDGVHVHPATLRVALAARPEGAMLVTDAMPPVGGRGRSFDLMGRTIQVDGDSCRAADGTLAGSALSMVQAFRNAMDMLGCTMVQASRMASGHPAAFLRVQARTGAIIPGLQADLVHLDADRRVTRSWIGGVLSEDGEAETLSPA